MLCLFLFRRLAAHEYGVFRKWGGLRICTEAVQSAATAQLNPSLGRKAWLIDMDKWTVRDPFEVVNH